jgi:RNA polymerase sigma-70 factor (ECF subfamily)
MRARRAQDAEVDRALIERAQRGDKAAFRQIVDRYERRAVMLAMAIVRDENDARELAQEAFLRVYRHLDDFNRDSTFFTWLYRIITNLGIDFLRRPFHKYAAADTDPVDPDQGLDLDAPFIGRLEGANPADVVRRREIASRIQEALEALPSYHRAAIVMREIDGLSYEEMAEVAGVSKGTIMSRLFHARQKLQRALGEYYEEQIGPRAPIGASARDVPGADE